MSYHFTMCGSLEPSGAYRHRLQWLLADSYSVPRFQNKLRIKSSINTWCGVKDTHEGLLSHMLQWSAVRWCINTDSPLSPWWDQKMLISKKAYLWYFFLFWTVLSRQCLSRSEPSGGGSASVGIALFLRLSWGEWAQQWGVSLCWQTVCSQGLPHEALIKAFCLGPVNAHRLRLQLTCNTNI